MLRGERTWLRPLERRDLDAYRRGCTDGETGTLAGYPYPGSEARIEVWFARISEGYGTEGFWFTVCELGSDVFAGTAWLKGLDLINSSAEFSIFISNKAWWGKGYGTDVLNTIVDFGFGQFPLERIYLKVDSSNERALASYRKAGFVVEGVMRHDQRTRGSYADSILMSLLRAEWEALGRRRSWEWSGAGEAEHAGPEPA